MGAQLAVLGAALGYACAGLYGRRFRGQPVLVTAGAQVTASSLMLLPLVLLLVTLLNPVRASALAVLLLDQWPGPRELAGMAIVGVALLVLDGRLPARLRRGPRLPPAAR